MNPMGGEMRDKFLLEILEKYVPGADYLDVGPLYGTVNETLSVAAKYSPRSLSAADIDPLSSDSWAALRSHLASKNIEGVKEFSTSIDDPTIVDKMGTYDFVYSAGILYHVPSPVYTLQQYRKLTRKYFLLGTMVVPEKMENEAGALDFSGGKLIYVPAIGKDERKVVAAHYDKFNMQIHHINMEGSWNWLSNGEPSYGPWWWLYSSSTCRRMIETSGLKVISEESTWDGRHHYFFCER